MQYFKLAGLREMGIFKVVFLSEVDFRRVRMSDVHVSYYLLIKI